MKKNKPLFSISPSVIDWLCEGDASISYQVRRDLVDSGTKKLIEEKKRINSSGWAQQLLNRQDPEGTWAHSYYSPKWTSTFYTLLLLRHLEANPEKKIIKAINILLDKGFSHDHGINFWTSIKNSDTCVNGMFLSIACYFGLKDERIPLLVNHLLKRQMKDGGWNCEDTKGAVHSSFHTTLSVMEGLHLSIPLVKPDVQAVIQNSIARGIEFLLQHRLFRSHRTGSIVQPAMTLFSFPCHWKYDILKCLDFSQLAHVPKDDRFQDAIEILHSKQSAEGTWKLQNVHSGKMFFHMEKAGQPSRWNTLRALRVLKWWNQ